MDVDYHIFEEAMRLVTGDRLESYGHPTESFKRFALVWTAILLPKLKEEITPEEAAMMMAAFKLCREANQKKEDNRIDAVAYILLEDIILKSKGQK